MKFKSWIKENSSLLKEFNSTNLYDFYALELTQDKINDPDIKELLIDRGNRLLDDIIDSIGFVLLNRYAGLFNSCIMSKKPETSSIDELSKPINKSDKDFPPNLLQDIKPFRKIFDIIHLKFPNWSWKTITENHDLVDEWDKLTKPQKKELVTLSRLILKLSDCNLTAASNSFSESWNSIYELYISYADTPPIIKPKAITTAINSITQLVHNNGSILMYLPPALDKAIQTRDIATLPQLLGQASDDVRMLLRSASLQSGGLTIQNPPLDGDLLLVGIRRQLHKSSDLISVNIKKQSIVRSELGKDSLIVHYEITGKPLEYDNNPIVWTSHTYLKHFLNPNANKIITTNLLWDTVSNPLIDKRFDQETRNQLASSQHPTRSKTPLGRYNDFMDLADNVLVDFEIQYNNIVTAYYKLGVKNSQ